jgi:hypothetical protein
LKTTHDSIAGGDHWRISSAHGAIHVWRPPGYHAGSAGTLVYVHGHGSSSDEAWSSHGLAAKFRASKQNALFVVPDAQVSPTDTIKWAALGELLKTVTRATKVPRPPGRIVVVGHSGAFKQIEGWLDYTPLDHIILIDALFGGVQEFRAWLETAKGHADNKLTVIATDRTMGNAKDFISGLSGVVKVDRIPDKFEDFPKKARTARVLFIRSQYGHMELVTSQRVLPVLLRRTPLRPLGPLAPVKKTVQVTVPGAPLPVPVPVPVPTPAPKP